MTVLNKITMPQIHIKIVGKTEEEKMKLTTSITQAVIDDVHTNEDNISISIEDIEKSDWVEKVYKPDILGHPELLYKKPGYDPIVP
jgi:4-oxalocrotonate tautomerase